ncbi:hypothetical protein AC00_2154 [Escherichia coli 1-250-04_S3_C1]|uniref:Uncharacterized protein n=1 Tax=Escherichia coli 1-250-04_S3_C1 TaxID=1444135 RepID=A0AAN4NTV8_ECOLX|nr:hypothetical protein AC00_2154 [Escherichia coli 1-250-04_S3_C1]
MIWEVLNFFCLIIATIKQLSHLRYCWYLPYFIAINKNFHSL